MPLLSPTRRVLSVIGAVALVALSCGRELTGPGTTSVNAFRRVASFAFAPQYETAVRGPALQAALAEVAFERVRITLRREDGTVALDTVILFPVGQETLTLSLNVLLPPGAPAGGVPMSLNLRYVNAAGDTVFSGGPTAVTVAPSTGGTPPAPVQVPVQYSGPGANATRVVISPSSAAGLVGQLVSFGAQAMSASNQPIANTPIVYTSSNPLIVRVNSPTAGAATLLARGRAYVIAQLLTGPKDSAQVDVLLPASVLALVSGSGQSARVSTVLAEQIVAKVTASDGVPVAGVTVNYAVTSGGGSVTPASATSDVNGLVRATWTLGATPGTQGVSVTSTGLTGSPLSVTATAQALPAAALVVSTQPVASKITDATLSTVRVTAQDVLGNTATTFTGNVTVALSSNPSGATLGGTTTVQAVAGVATFSTLTLDRLGNGYSFVISTTGLPSVTSGPFAVTAGDAAMLAFSAMPTSVEAAGTLALTVSALDARGNTAPFTGAVTVAFGASPAGAVLSGTKTRSAVNGVATFNDLSIDRRGTGYTLVASASGLSGGTSGAFTVKAAEPTTFVIRRGDLQSRATGTRLDTIEVQVKDVIGNGVDGRTVTFAVTQGGGTITAATAITDTAGVARVLWTIGSGPQLMTATFTGPPALPVLTIKATGLAGPAAKLAVVTAPGTTQTAGASLTPPIVVQAQDVGGAVQSAFTGVVTAAIAAGPAGAPLGGTTTATAVAGAATFGALRLTKAGTYSLSFSATGLTSVTTTSLVVNAAPAKTIAADSGNAQSGNAGTLLAQPFVVVVIDSLGNPVSGTTVTWAVASGGGSVSAASTTTDANGRARSTLTLGTAAGANSVTASSTGLAGSPITFTATAISQGIASTAFAQHLDSLFSFGDTVRRVPVSRDASSNVVQGVYTFVSRGTTVATVSTTGLITAIADGATWVVATEAGGTRDSTRLVVQQRIATINVTPGTRSVYRSRTFQFAASTVDGRGNAMTGAAITWSTLVPSIATVGTTGLVTAVALGTTQVRATAGSVTGVANLTVLTPVTRIIVGRDSSSVPVSDTTAMPSLGIGRRYRAEARDTLDAVMTGVTFAFSSTNTSVALLDSATSVTARALSNANGTTAIQATADGVTGSAALKVQQVLASIELTPTPDTIGISGTVQLTARGKDANARYISGGAFTYTSSSTPVATVSTTGAVTGIALGTANVTATSGAITSNNAVIVVSTTVPPSISFGRDTLSVGRGSSVSIPIFLSRPNASIVTVNLAARDTNAYFSAASVNIPVGTTAMNVTLNGRNAGTTLLYATDGSGTGFKGDTAAVAVTANMRFAQTSWSLNATDQVSSQVLLSDPSPAGGTFVTFTYGTAGRAQISPDPAFIPAGQLASNIVITALGSTSGSTTITPVATGVNGTASTLNVSAPVLTISAGATARLGAGQYENGWYAYTPQYSNVAVPLTYTSSDTNVVTVSPASGAIPASSYYQYFTVSGKAAGTARVIVSASGWKPDTLLMTITSPRTTISASTSLNTTSPVQSATVYATDSVGTAHYRTSSLALNVSSSDTAVIKVIDATPTIAAGAYYGSGIRYQPGGTGGTAYIKVVAGGHRPDSVLVTVVGPKLQFSWTSSQLGKGQYDQNVYVQTPNNAVTPLVVTVSNSDATKATVPATVTIPTGTYYQYFNVAGLDTGLVTLIASAPGYQPDTATYRISSPRVTLSGGGTINNFRPPFAFTAYSTDSVGTTHYRTASLALAFRSTNTAVITVDSATATLGAGLYYHNTAHVRAVGVGTAYLVVSAAGHRPDSVLYTVQTPKLNFSFTSVLLGRRQYYGSTDFYVYTPDNVNSPLAVTITQKRGTVDSLSTAAPTIPSASYYAYFGVAGLTAGVDTLIASATGYLPDTAIIRVTPQRLTVGSMPSTALTTSAPGNVYLYATDSVGTTHYVLDTVIVRVTSSDTTVIKPTLPYIRIPRGQYYLANGFSYVGPGTASLTFTDSAGTGYGSVTTNSVTVTGPSLQFSTSSVMYGMRQRGSSTDIYVYTANNVASPLTINLVSTSTRVATVPATVTIPANSSYAYFTVTALDTVGTIQVQATASGYGPATPMTVQVTQPKFTFSVNTSTRTTGGPQTITLYATDANGNAHYTTENVTVTLASSAPGVFTVDSSTVTIAAGAYYHNTAHWSPVAVGSAQLSATDARAAIYKYNAATANLAVTTPSLSFSWTSRQLGLGQYIDQVYDGSTYVQTTDYQAAPLTVALAHVGTARATTPASVTIPTSGYYQYFRLSGAVLGTDTLIATAASPYHNADTAYTVVGLGRLDGIVGWPTASMRVGDSVAVTLRTLDPNASSIRRVTAATTFTLAPNANIQFRSGGASSAVVTSVVVPADGSQVSFYIKALTSGSGSATITNANYQTYTNTVTVIP